MSYSLAAAAAASGVNKSTVLRAIKSGRISGTRDDAGQWRVEPAELHRIFPPAAPHRSEADALPQHAIVEAQLAVAHERIIELKQRIGEIAAERDAWREQAQRLTLPAARPRSWWRWGAQ